MPFITNPDREHQEKLKKFRANFLFLIKDGSFPPHRQQRLFQWCKKWDLNWDEARKFIAPDAVVFLEQLIGRLVSDHQVSYSEIAGLRTLQRRLNLPDEQAGPIHRLYDLVEHKLELVILERAAYLSALPAVDSLRKMIQSYDLPDDRAVRLESLLTRQHELAKLMAGVLPIITPSVTLYKDELCHLEVLATFTPLSAPAKATYGGQLIATSLRLMLLSAAGGFAFPWSDLHSLTPFGDSFQLIARASSGTVYCHDPQYVVTLLAATRKLYNPGAPPEPKRPDRKLPMLG